MRVGLVRHFKVNLELPKKSFITRDELLEWINEYDKADIEYGEVDLCSIPWGKCYSSDLPRAVKTAERIYNGNIIALQELREFEVLRLFKRNYKLPFLLWLILPRIKQLLSNRYTNDYTRQIKSFLDEILSKSDESALIVSHGFTMLFLKKELLKRGFKGVDFKHPDNGKLYMFEK